MGTFGVAVFSFDGIKDVASSLESAAWADRILLLHLGTDAPSVGSRELPALAVRRLASWSEAEKHCEEIGTDWVLYLWGGERLDAGVVRALREFRGTPEPGGVYTLRIRSLILNEWVEGGLSGPSPSPRLARGKENPLGWWLKRPPAGEVGEGWIEDHGTAELALAVERAQALSDYWAARLIQTSAPPSALATIFAAAGVKLRMLLRGGIFGHGLAGIALAALAGYSVLLSGAKLWEARHANGRG
ncbi:MAG TPA: hypothetical protein VGH16_08385 [Candidatus Binatia bacterium]|jgi:hypothetical protein